MSKLFPIIRNNPFTGQVRFLPRWTHRRPIRVIPAEEYDKNVDKPKIIKVKPVSGDITENHGYTLFPSSSRSRASENFSTEHNSQTRKIPKPLTISKIRNESGKQFDMLETVIDGDGNFVYSKMKNNDSRVGSILVEVKSKKEKEKKDLILLEGKRLIKDALNAGCKLEYILFSRKKELEYLKPFLPK
ncbi:hypothetical protein NQ317_017470 [Molorchus minor]|uniref:Uncharacterized protein n=1 Tax=Molorchus minor TaxID=1323400 RepID=A0ABQ9J0F7_9CUCU|nr:hypothetical protein NQ317_017470 [Molorchus minor]